MERSSRRLQEQTEPTVLDWFKSLLRLKPIPIPQAGSTEAVSLSVQARVAENAELEAAPRVGLQLSWSHIRLPAALILALFGQIGLEKRGTGLWLSLALYLIAIGLVTWSMKAKDLSLEAPPQSVRLASGQTVRLPYLAAGFLLGMATFLASEGNQFRLSTLIFWGSSLICTVIGLWEGPSPLSQFWGRIRAWLAGPGVWLPLDGWKLAILLAFGVAAYFRLARLAEVPYEMWSDHAEKLLDVVDVLDGGTSIYFPRNTGREPMQIYVAAATAKWFGTGISFLTLKIGTAIAGLLTLPYLYLFAKEIGGRKVGLAALLLSGVAYWPNVISRAGLRFPLYPLFAAPALYYLLRGLRLQRRNDLLLCGLAIGLGMYGYSPARVIPFAVVMGVALWLMHRDAGSQRWRVIAWLGVAALMALIVFVPLLRAAHDMPELFLVRTLTRIGTAEREYPGNPLVILVSNLWNGLRMFNWDNGEIGVVSIPHRPALDWVTGSLFILGLAMLALRFVTERRWHDIFVLLSIPILMAPSVLSLAFPAENPAPNRASGAMVPVFTIAALPLAALPSWGAQVWKGRGGRIFGLSLAGGLFLVAAATNYRLVMVEYEEQVGRASWNTSEAGALLGDFARSIGSYDTAYVIAYPHWMDTRLVGIIAGRPTRDYGIWPEQLEQLPPTKDAQLFVLNIQDQEALERLERLYPTGSLSRWESAQQGKDFFIYFVPAQREAKVPSEGAS